MKNPARPYRLGSGRTAQLTVERAQCAFDLSTLLRPASQATSAVSGGLRRPTSQVIPYHESYIFNSRSRSSRRRVETFSPERELFRFSTKKRSQRLRSIPQLVAPAVVSDRRGGRFVFSRPRLRPPSEKDVRRRAARGAETTPRVRRVLTAPTHEAKVRYRRPVILYSATSRSRALLVTAPTVVSGQAHSRGVRERAADPRYLCKTRVRPLERRRLITLMILPQVHLRKPCYDFYFL